jgi:hypothetical protein
MSDSPVVAARALQEELRAFEPDAYSGTDCAALAEELAKTSSLGVLKDKARSRRLRAMDVEELHRRQQAARELRHWTDDMGMVRLAGALPPEVGVPIVNRLDAETDRIRRVARRRGSDEPRSAHGADALVRIINNKGKGKTDRTDMVVVWDRSRAGENDEGRAHIVGGGPIPIAEARRLAERAFVKAVIHDGKRIETVVHVGRFIPAELRTALELGDPPGFEGLICIDCDKRCGIQRDHINPVANGGLTAYDNLAGRCWDCHEKKTEADRQAGLLGGKGHGKPRRGKREPRDQTPGVRCSRNQPRASPATVCRAPGSSNRCVAPGTTSSRFSPRSSPSARWLRPRTTSSRPPTMSRVGARTEPRSTPARSGRPPRETTADTPSGWRAAATRAAAPPVLAPKKPTGNPVTAGSIDNQSAMATRRPARRPMSNRR